MAEPSDFQNREILLLDLLSELWNFSTTVQQSMDLANKGPDMRLMLFSRQSSGN